MWTGLAIGVNPAELVENWQNATTNLVQLLQPDYWFFPQTLVALGETVQMAVIATAAGAVVSLPEPPGPRRTGAQFCR